MSDPIRILLSGPGLIGKKHASLVEENPATRLVAIVAPDNDHHAKFSENLNVKRFDDISTALSQCDVDAAIISSPNSWHFQQSSACIERGLPILIEKPLCDNLIDAAKLVDITEEWNARVLVGHHRTYSPLLEVAHKFITSEKFGKPVSLKGAALFYKPQEYFEAGPWRALEGGGPILINLIHEIGIMRYLFGEIDSVAAHMSRAVRGFEVEDTVSVTISFSNGALGTFLLSDTSASNKSWEMTAGENPAYPFFDEQDCYHFSGTMGSLDFPSMRARGYKTSSERSWWKPFEEHQIEIERKDPLVRQLEHFVDVVRGVANPRVTARDGYLNMVVVEAIRLAAERRRTVSISEIIS